MGTAPAAQGGTAMSRAVGDIKREGRSPGHRFHGRDTGGSGIPAAAVWLSALLAAPPRSVGARAGRG